MAIVIGVQRAPLEVDMKKQISMDTSCKVGKISSLFVAIMTLITWGFAMTAIPPAGPYCSENCIDYPYLDSLAQYPRDYIWMMLALIQLVGYVMFIISLHYAASEEKKIFSHIAMVFSIISATVLFIDYAVQVSVVPVSLMKGETDGIPLLIQYNGNGIFIALEELGFVTMSLSLFFASFIFNVRQEGERALRWILLAPLVLSIPALVFYSVQFGLNRSYRFEVATITVNWLTLIVAGFLAARFFTKKKLPIT